MWWFVDGVDWFVDGVDLVSLVEMLDTVDVGTMCRQEW